MEGFMNFLEVNSKAITQAVIQPLLGKYWAQWYGIILFVLFATLLVLFIVFLVKHLKSQKRLYDIGFKLSGCYKQIDEKNKEIKELNKQLELEKTKKNRTKRKK